MWMRDWCSLYWQRGRERRQSCNLYHNSWGGAGEVRRERESEEKVEVSRERFTPYVLYHQTPNVNYCPVSSA